MSGLLPLVALSICTTWLLYRDVKERRSVSPAAWIVVAWAVVYGSRPVTSWFSGVEQGAVLPESRDQGNPAEALVYLSLICAGLLVLLRRSIRWPVVVSDNTCLCVFYGFWVLSVLWSDYPLITFKRLFKDLGNVIMILVVLTGKEPGETIKAIFTRCAYVCIPLSVLFIRYYPDLGRSYSGYHRNEVMYVGVTPHKNTLGTLALVAALCVLWDLLGVRGRWLSTVEKVMFAARGLVLGMCWYLLLIADSVTSLVCAVLGSVLLIAFAVPAVGRSPGRAEVYGIGTVFVLWMLDPMFKIKEAFVERLGRDMTLTTRTDIWPILLSQQDNPLVGAGFNSFWAGDRLVQLSESLGGIIQAHNGYLETYLNGGVVGVGLLAVLLVSGYWSIRKELILGTGSASIRFVFIVLAIVHNFSEASFNKQSLLWLVTVLAIMNCRRLSPSEEAVNEGRDVAEGGQWWSTAGGRRA
jgi:exopolysaccharide production protein ExoQ